MTSDPLTRRGFLRATTTTGMTLLTRRTWAKEEASDADRYVAIVRRYADTMIERGRDRYGRVHTGMFMSVLDRSTLAPPAKLPKGPGGVRSGDRCDCFGSNLHHDGRRAALRPAPPRPCLE